METMRDAFFNRLFDFAKDDPSIMVLTSDFSAPSFDRYRTDLPGQFVNVGISEQNAILVSSGLAMSGMKVFVVSIAPFITMRCFEQIRLYPADMNLDVTIVGVGAGLSYSEAGATHHSVEDIGLMSMVPNMRILSPCDRSVTKAFVQQIIRDGGPHYLRLDRRGLPDVYPEDKTFAGSLECLQPGKRVCLMATGYMTHRALEVAAVLRKHGIEPAVVDVMRLPLDEDEFLGAMQGIDIIVSMEEHGAVGGMGEQILHLANRHRLRVDILPLSLDFRHELCHTYGDRSLLHTRHGMDCGAIPEMIVKHLAEKEQREK